MKVALASAAERDLAARVAWLAVRNPDAAAALLEELDTALRFLARHPDAGRVVEPCEGLRRGVRHWPLPTLAIYYEIRGRDTIAVARLRHGLRRPIPW